MANDYQELDQETFDPVAYINTFLPVVGLRIYGSGAAITMRARSRTHNAPPARGNRGEIVQLTDKSRKLAAFTIIATSVEFYSIITLTYGKEVPTDGRTVKLHLSRFIKWLNRYGVEHYFWVIEFQARGAPHYHIMTDVRYPSTSDRQNLATAWLRASGYDTSQLVVVPLDRPGVKHIPVGSEWHVELMNRLKVTRHPKSWEPIHELDGARRYMLKYALKPHQKVVPDQYQNVGRFWGCSKSVRQGIQEVYQWELNEDTLRQILEDCNSWARDKPLIPKYLLDVNLDIGNDGM
jgi:hypothetical protein